MNYNFGKRGIFAFTDPAGANSILAIIDDLIAQHQVPNKDFLVVTNNQGKYDSFSYPFVLNEEFSTEVAQGLIDSFKPDYIFTATSVHQFEHEWRKISLDNKIFCFGFVDHWVLYKERFSFDRELVYPDEILVVNEVAKKEAIQEGVPEDRIKCFGNPYYGKVRKFKPIVKKVELFESHQLSIWKKTILFVSESIRFCDDFPKNSKGISYLGFDEFTVLEDTLNTLRILSLQGENLSNVQFIVKIHPISPHDKFDALINSGQFDFLNIKVIKNIDPLSLVYYTDLVVGMFSNLLIDALLMGKKVLRVQTGVNTVDLMKFDLVTSEAITETYLLQSELKEFLSQEQ